MNRSKKLRKPRKEKAKRKRRRWKNRGKLNSKGNWTLN